MSDLFFMAILFGYFVGLPMAAAFFIHGKAKWDSNNPTVFYFMRKRYQLYRDQGVAISPSTHTTVTTHVSGGGSDGRGGSNPISSSNVTTDHLQVFIKHKDGSETSHQLVNLTTPIRDGHLISIVWAIPEGSNSGKYILLKNHTTQATRVSFSTIDRRLSYAVPLLFMVFGLLVGFIVYATTALLIELVLKNKKHLEQKIIELYVPNLDADIQHS